MHFLNRKYKSLKSNNSAIFALLFILLTFVFSQENYAGEHQSSLIIDSVSVDKNNGNVIIGWTLETDVANGYIEVHRRHLSGEYTPIATLSLDENSFIDNGANANDRAYAYYVVARDLNETSFAVSFVHKTSYLAEPLYDVCDNSVDLSWDNYEVTTSAGQPQPQPSPFNQINIWAKANENDWQKLLVVNNDVNNAVVSTHITGDLCFFLEYFNSDAGITSSSNMKCINVEALLQPEFIYIEAVTVAGSEIDVVVYVDNEVSQPSYVLHKSLSPSDGFSPLDTITSENSFITFADTDVNIYSDIYYYYAEALDSCMNSQLTSNTANSIRLSGFESSYNENKLFWNEYVGWPTGVEKYEVYRMAPQDVDLTLIATLDNDELQYTDVINDNNYSGEDPSYLYFVRAVENDYNPFDLKATAKSNTVVIEREPEIFVPNAFKPDSNIEANRVFKADFGFYEPAEFKMIIINKWGSRVFVTSDINNGWNGKLNGVEAEAGAYSYLIKWENYNGKTFEKKGVVNLIR